MRSEQPDPPQIRLAGTDIMPAGDDNILPFQVEDLDIRGRAVQLGPMLNNILDNHSYPEPVSRLLAQAICLGALLGSSLKFEGRFIIQTSSDGPVSFLVVEYKTSNTIRAYARYDDEKLDKLIQRENTQSAHLMGKGVLAMTIDQEANSQPYQGIVELDGQNLEDVAHQYFRQSEQIPTKVRLGIAQLVKNDENGKLKTTWRAGGLIAQFLPDAPERMRRRDLPSGNEIADHQFEFLPDDSWSLAQSLVETVSDDELTDPQIGSEKLLYRLFHQQGVHISPASQLINECSCSHEKVTAIIDAFSATERESALAASNKPGFIESKCEFCSECYEISVQEIAN